MKRSKKQLNAISRSYSDKNLKAVREQLEQKGLKVVYDYQKTYTTERGLLHASDKKLKIVIDEALQNVEIKLNRLINYKANETIIDEVLKIKSLIEKQKKILEEKK